jgi:hypothetical protein
LAARTISRPTASWRTRCWSVRRPRTAAGENRAFLGRAVTFLAAEGGIQQFLDIGTGLPTSSSVHQVAQAITPSARIVYADNDPLVLAHARALLTSSPDGRTAYIQADLRHPELILASPVVREVIDFGQPVALMLVAILHMKRIRASVVLGGRACCDQAADGPDVGPEPG